MKGAGTLRASAALPALPRSTSREGNSVLSGQAASRSTWNGRKRISHRHLRSRAAGAEMECSFDEAVTRRRSIRKYDGCEVPDSSLTELLDLARRAPSSMNGQPCHFVVIRNRATCEKLAQIKNIHCPPEKRDYPADFLVEAPVIVAVCVERERSFAREIENGVLVSGFLLLAAASRGLTGVFLTAYNRNDPTLEADIREILKLPDGIDPVSLIPLGYPAVEPSPKLLRSMEEIVRREHFA